jgi:cytochrome c-type biogenesis protein CcmH/NrfG
MTDIVERLRRVGIGAQVNAIEHDRQAGKDGADEIERLRDALRYMVENPEDVESFWQIARVALGEGKE